MELIGSKIDGTSKSLGTSTKIKSIVPLVLNAPLNLLGLLVRCCNNKRNASHKSILTILRITKYDYSTHYNHALS
jgi:hypothetical protein